MADDAIERREQLAEQADYHARALERRREQESAQAQLLVDDFVRRATAAGLATEELTARPWSGGGRYRTGVLGWYLRHPVAPAAEGGFNGHQRFRMGTGALLRGQTEHCLLAVRGKPQSCVP